MMDSREFLLEMIKLPGLSGYEKPVRHLIADAWRPLVDHLSISKLGSLHGFRAGDGKSPRQSILIVTHMDAIGFLVTGFINGFIRFSKIGGVDPRCLPGQEVTIHGRKALPGVIVTPPMRLLPPGTSETPNNLQHLFIDTGLTHEALKKLVQVGDLISFARQPMGLTDDIIAGHSLDNRASVVALTICLEALRTQILNWDVWVVASTQEEEGAAGAYTSGFQIKPDLAIAIDVTFARSPGSPDSGTFPLSGGITIGWGASIHPGLTGVFKNLADRLEIPYKLEIMPSKSGTDADGLQMTAEGIPCMLISIPIRYMHTPVEMVSMMDVHRAGRLVAEFILQLTPNFLEQLKWED